MVIGVRDARRGERVALSSRTAAGVQVLAQRRAERTRRIAEPLAGLSPDDVVRIADAVPALVRLADALRRPRTPVEVAR